jgi:signal transduction histidine kinase
LSSCEPIRILVVEDEGLAALDTGEQLQALGYTVIGSVFSASDAIRKVEECRPDVVLMDIRLKGRTDGIAAAKEIRSRFDIPIIFATAYADDATVQRAKVAEPFGYILKPFDDRELRASIEMALYRHRMERQRADFLAMLSHDIRNPLGVVLGYTEILGMAVRTGDLAQAEELLQRLISTTLSVHSLVTNYLEVSRIESGRLSLRREPLQLNDLVTSVRDQYEAEANRRRIRFETSLQHPLPLADVDPAAAERILANLVYNALKFTPVEGRVTIRSVAHGEEILLTITDTGGGIPPELHSRLFDRYQSSVALRQETGAGLGLFIVKTLVEAHGGRVEVRSTPGEGTTFAVFLPAAAPRAASAG